MRNQASFVAFTHRLEQKPWAFTFFAAMRGLEERRPDIPRFSEASSPAQEMMRLGQFPELSFPLSDLHSLWTHESSSKPVLNVQFSGLLGSQGVFPLHITEYARERWVHEKDRTLVCFLNMFQHRWFTLFYRAWANSQPVVALHRPEPSTPARILAALAGDEKQGADPQRIRLAGFYQSQRRSAEGLAAVAFEMTGIKPKVREFAGAWLPISKVDRSCLASHSKSNVSTVLGRGAVLGKRVWDVQGRVELEFAVSSLADYERFNSNTKKMLPFRQAVDDFLNGQFDWGLKLVLPSAEAPASRLGNRSQLGWNAWLGQASKRGPRCEVIRRTGKGVSRLA